MILMRQFLGYLKNKLPLRTKWEQREGLKILNKNPNTGTSSHYLDKIKQIQKQAFSLTL